MNHTHTLFAFGISQEGLVDHLCSQRYSLRWHVNRLPAFSSGDRPDSFPWFFRGCGQNFDYVGAQPHHTSRICKVITYRIAHSPFQLKFISANNAPFPASREIGEWADGIGI